MHQFFPLGRLDRCVPYFLHLDEGTGLRKTGVLVFSAQTVFGQETANRFDEAFGRSCRSTDSAMTCMTKAQFHNAKGSTYRTRYLYTAIPKRWYGRKNSHIYTKILDQLSHEALDLFNDGLQVRGAKFYFVCLGLKADQPAQAKAGCFKRSFLNMGFNRCCCFECFAGLNEYPFEDTRDTPSWLHTIGQGLPWSTNVSQQSPLLQIPFMEEQSEKFFKKDPFHIFKQSLGGHFVASTIVLLMDLGYYTVVGDRNSVEELFERTYYDFSFFAKHEFRGKTVPYIKHFTRLLFHFTRHTSFPFGRFKGSDTMLLIRWLQHLTLHGPIFEGELLRGGRDLAERPLQRWHGEVFQQVKAACRNGLAFFHLLHTSGIWLMPNVSSAMSAAAGKFCQSYTALARICHGQGLCRYHLEPSLHYFYHFKYDLKSDDILINPATQNCEGDEDFIGKICRLARCVHASSTCVRVLERYLIKCYFDFEGIQL